MMGIKNIIYERSLLRYQKSKFPLNFLSIKYERDFLHPKQIPLKEL
jgi:hypothetical protein